MFSRGIRLGALAVVATAACFIASLVPGQSGRPSNTGEHWVATCATAQQFMATPVGGRSGAPPSNLPATFADHHRAIGGLSMGAMQSVSIGLSHPELFQYVLAYSGGFGSLGLVPADGPVGEQAPWKQLLANSAETKKWLHLLFLGSGQQETGMLVPGQRLVQLFKENGINAQWADHPGGHVFSVSAIT